MKNSKYVLGLFAALTVTALVACGDDSSSAPTSAPVEDLTGSSSASVVDSILVEPADDSIKSSSSANAVMDSSKDLNEVNCFEIGKNNVTTPVRCDNGLYFEKKSEFISFAEQEREKNKLFAYNCSEIATLCYDFLDSDGNMNGDCVPDIMCPAEKDEHPNIDRNDIDNPLPSCGTAVYTEKCIDTEIEGETCAAIGCRPTDCFEEQKGMEAYSCNGGSVMICDGTRWQYTNCAKPIIDPNSSSSSIVILDPDRGSSSSSEWRGGECIDQEGDTRYDDMYEYECKNEKWVIIGYRPGACHGDMDCGTSNVSSEQTRCKALVVDGLQVEGSACKIEDGYHKSENGCEFFCDGSKWIYTPPPM